jgi:type IV pilus assembly protein PilA
MLRKLRNRKGFTLVELMIVVAIIGILAAIAIPNFLNFRLKAKTSEAKSNLGAIRSTEVAYYAEWSTWVGAQTFVPINDRTGNDFKEPWANGGTVSRFSILGFAPEGNVFFSYDMEGTEWPVGSDGFTSNAQGDLDTDDVISNYKITSNDTEIRHSGGPF